MSVTERKVNKRVKKAVESPPAAIVEVAPVVAPTPPVIAPPAPPVEPEVAIEHDVAESILGKKVQKPKKIISHAEKQIVVLLKQLDTLKASSGKEITKNKQVKLHHNLELSVHNLKNMVDSLKQCIVEKPSRNTSSGFMKRVKISDQLRLFGMTHGGWMSTDTEMSRVDATKAICAHIQKMELGDPTDRRKIKMSPELKALFTDVSGDYTSYPEIQKQIQRHFVTMPSAVTA